MIQIHDPRPAGRFQYGDEGFFLDEDGEVAGRWSRSRGRWAHLEGKQQGPPRWYRIEVNINYRRDQNPDYRVIDFTDQLTDKGPTIVHAFHADNGDRSW